MFAFKVILLCLGLFFLTGTKSESVEKVELIEQNWPFKGFFGRFDDSSIQRGFQVYREVCAACHGIKYIAFNRFQYRTTRGKNYKCFQ